MNEQPSEKPTASGRDQSGRFVAGHPGPRLDTGTRSDLVRSGEATGTEAAVAAARAELRDDLGDVGVIKASAADRFVELDAIANYLSGRLQVEGPLTAKGRTRALLSAYLSVVDRQVKLAQLLGVERRAKPVDPLEAVRAAVVEANK